MVLSRFFPTFDKVTIATTSEEREAIYRFRYSVYGSELRWNYGGVDHEAKLVRDDLDEQETTYHVYAGTLDAIKGVARITTFAAGAATPGFREDFSLALFPNIDDLRICEIGRFMIDKSMRGKLVLPSMARVTYDFIVGELQMDLCFNLCKPALVPLYRKLGARPYGGKLRSYDDLGLTVPMVAVLSDHAYFRSVGAIQTPQIRKHFGKGRRDPVDSAPFEHLFESDERQIEYEEAQVWDEMETELVTQTAEGPSLLDSLSERTMKAIAANGLLINVSPGEKIVVEGRGEREVYVVVEGTFEVSVKGEVIRYLGKGQVFGEMAFFRDSGVRTASVSAASDGKLVMLQRKFVRELAKKDPQEAVTLLFNLGRILTERFAGPT